MTLEVIEYKPVIVMIPANNDGIRNLVFKTPVTSPAIKPPPKAASVAIKGLTPLTRHIVAIAPPKGKLPSAVISAKSRIRKVKYTPMAISDQSNPCEDAERSNSQKVFNIVLHSRYLSAIYLGALMELGSIPSALAIFLLTTNCNFSAFSTGISAGLALPSKILAAIFPVCSPSDS